MEDGGGSLGWCRAEGWALGVGRLDVGGTGGLRERRPEGIGQGEFWKQSGSLALAVLTSLGPLLCSWL